MTTSRSEEWWERGACRDHPFPQIFEVRHSRRGRPRKNGTYTQRDEWDAAREVCGSCPVKKECLEAALNAPAPVAGQHEMFTAGFTPEQMSKLRVEWAKKKRRRTA